MTSSLSGDEVRIVPLGGLGEIGMNCFAVEQDDGIVVVDCGATFPDDDLGVDILHPDFTWLLERRDRVKGVFLTHGHEDHVGALPYLLDELDCPVWGPPHALGVATRRLADRDFDLEELDLRIAEPRQTYEVGPFTIEPIRVAHSIVEASALRIATRAGNILHSGDFNFDPDPPDGEPTDEARLEAMGDEGVALLMSDSTNIDVPERGGSERGVAAAVERLVRAASGRVVIAMFASNVQRLITFGDVAQRLGRKLCLLGRSLETQAAIAKEIRRLHWPSDLLIGPEQAREFPRDQFMALAGGTQAERLSAMRRLSLGTHPLLALDEGDTVIFSSRPIPGNERPVFAMINDLLRMKIRVHNRITDPEVHTSGHAGRTELSRMIELVRPRSFVPVHGTLHHLLRHEALAKELGVERTLVVENGTPIRLSERSLATDEPVTHGRVAIAMGGERLDAETLQARGELGRQGSVVVVLVRRGPKLVAPPTVIARGVPRIQGDPTAIRTLEREAVQSYDAYRENRGVSAEEWVRRAIRRKCEAISGTRPACEVRVTESF